MYIEPSYRYVGWEKKMRTIGPHLPELYQKMWLFLWAYSMEFITKETQVSPNRPKGILSCRAWKVLFVGKSQPSMSFFWEWYRPHNFIWKSSKFVKNQKNLQNLWAWVFSSYMVKKEFRIYILVLHELAYSPICFFLLCICMKKLFFGTQ